MFHKSCKNIYFINQAVRNHEVVSASRDTSAIYIVSQIITCTRLSGFYSSVLWCYRRKNLVDGYCGSNISLKETMKEEIVYRSSTWLVEFSLSWCWMHKEERAHNLYLVSSFHLVHTVWNIPKA